MAIAYICVLIAAIMPIIFAAYAKFSVKGYDNSTPREFLEKLEGRGKRSHYAHLNSFEAFPGFAAGVIIAQLAGVSVAQITILAISFVIFRIFYGIFYIIDNHVLRSIVWFCAFFCVLVLFISAIRHS